MADTSIEWTDKVWNPVTGCSKVSQGCKNCYAEGVADRFFAKQYEPNADGSPRKFTDVRCHEDRLDAPLRWRKPSRIFVNSMSDLFHPDVSFKFIDKVFAVMALCPQHTFQILTKRPERMLRYLTTKHRNPQGWPEEDYDVQTCIRLSLGGLLGAKTNSEGKPDLHSYFNSDKPERYAAADKRIFYQWPLPNVWLGVSVENQKAADVRIPLLLQTPAAVRWISAEPLLGPIDFDSTHESDPCASNFLTGIAGERVYDGQKCALDWVVCGGESGPHARPMHPDWARSLRDQCQAAGVPYFFKQWGEWAPESKVGYHEKTASCRYGEFHVGDGEWVESCLCAEGAAGAQMYRVGKAIAGRLLDGREWKEYPQVRKEQSCQ